MGGSDPALESTKHLVTDKLQDANHRYTTLHTKVRGAGTRQADTPAPDVDVCVCVCVRARSPPSWAGACRVWWSDTSSTRTRWSPSTRG